VHDPMTAAPESSSSGTPEPARGSATAGPSNLPGDPRACSTKTTATPTWRAIQEQPVILSANYPRPERRSTDGQEILKAIRLDFQTGSDLAFQVELRRFELRTSCMPYVAT